MLKENIESFPIVLEGNPCSLPVPCGFLFYLMQQSQFYEIWQLLEI